MLSPYHKEELIGWVLLRLDWLKVVLVANRADSKDSSLLESARKQLSSASTCIVQQYLYHKASFTEDLIPNTDPNKSNTVEFVVKWHCACRALFSDESLSLRTVKRLVEEYQKPKTNGARFIENMESVLLPKMPFLGVFCCHKFTQYLCELYESGNISDIALPKAETSPLRLLVKTALADVDGELISFPEFSSRMKASHRVHPVVRLAAWVKTIWLQKGYTEAEVLPMLGCLSRLQLVDQAKFPFIKGECGATNFATCKVFSKHGDFTDIMWLADVINHGHTVNWQVVKDAWATNFISSSSEFSHLLSVCPDPGACLASVVPKNLCILIEGDDGTTIAECCVAHNRKGDDEDDPNSVYYTAAWNLFRNALVLFKQLKLNRLQTLLWASQFAFSLSRVKEHPGESTQRLQKALIEETNTLLESGGVQSEKCMASLWNLLFAGLLVVDLNQGIPPAAALALSRKVHPIPSEWPEVIKLLAYVEDGTVTNSQLERLFDSGFFTLYKDKSPGEAPLDEQFIMRLISLPKRVVGVRWQVAVLTSVRVTLHNEYSSLASVLEDGLRALDGQKITLQGPNTDALRKLAVETMVN